MKSLHILHSEAASGWGGQEIRIFQEITHLLKRGHRVTLVCQPESPLAERCRNLAHSSFFLHPFRMRRSLDVSAFLSLRGIVKRARPDILHTHSSIDSWLLGFVGKSLGIPIVRSRHISIPVRNYFPNTWLYSRLPERIITSGEAIRQLMIEVVGVDPEKVFSISAGVDLERFDFNIPGEGFRIELGIDKECPLVGKVGVIRGWKGYQYFLEAVPLILETLPQTKFVIAGSGPGYDEVRETVRTTKLEESVRVLGHREDIPEIMAALDVLVLASFAGEGTPQVIPQAFAMKTPVVATKVGSIPELFLDGGRGVLVEPKNGKSLAEGILRVLNDREAARQRADKAYEHCCGELTIDRMIDQTLSVYEEVLSGH